AVGHHRVERGDTRAAGVRTLRCRNAGRPAPGRELYGRIFEPFRRLRVSPCDPRGWSPSCRLMDINRLYSWLDSAPGTAPVSRLSYVREAAGRSGPPTRP